MTGFDHQCQVHGIALRGDGRCFLCERDRPSNSSGPPGAPRFEVKERAQSATGTVLLAVAFFAGITLTALWAVSPDTITHLF